MSVLTDSSVLPSPGPSPTGHPQAGVMSQAVSAVIRDAVLDALDLLSPVECVGCGAAGRTVCDPCRRRLRADVHAAHREGIDAWCGLDYEGIAARVIVA